MTRLDALAAAIPESARCVADLGHDHGLLLAKLLRERASLRVVGVELRRGAEDDFRSRFASELACWGERLSLREGDAFEALAADEADVVVMAGLGERTMLAALDRGAELGRLPGRLVLCPASFEVALRPGLVERGWRFVSERLVFEAGRYFEVIAVEREGVEPEGEAELRWGPCLVRGPDPLLADFLEDTSRRQADALRIATRSESTSPLLEKLALLPTLARR